MLARTCQGCARPLPKVLGPAAGCGSPRARPSLSLLLLLPSRCVALRPEFLWSQGPALASSAVESSGSRPSFCDAGAGWEREWGDEFEGGALDPRAWSTIGSSERGPLGAPVGSLSVVACRTAVCRAENVRVSGGALRLLSERDAGNSSKFYTGAVTTKGRLSWADSPAYRLCVSARLPSGSQNQGVWPAHWMLPDNGISERCLDEGEMDIMEMINGDGQVYNTYHWMSSWPGQKCADFSTYHKSSARSTRMPATWSSDFHEYAVERSPDHVAYVVDGQVILNATTASLGTQLSHTPFFLVLNTAIGGPWPGEPTSSTSLPLEHAIDYVRVARKIRSGGPTPQQLPRQRTFGGSLLQSTEAPLRPPVGRPAGGPEAQT
mmetsp:Transcript_79956/g.242717  ORF Transcript_79956/g.242717 Transcript_79956/m.242717 type:complete len:378 (+) Transcript_79956:61-1194(+)